MFFLPSVSMSALFYVFKWLQGATKGIEGSTDHVILSLQKFQLTSLGQAIKRLIDVTFVYGNWNFVWLIWLLCWAYLFQRDKRNKIEGIILLMGTILFIGLYFAVGICTSNYIRIIGDESPWVLSRLFLHFYPLTVLYICIACHSLFSPGGATNTNSRNPNQQT